MQMHGRYIRLYDGTVIDADDILLISNQKHVHSRVGNCEIHMKHPVQDGTENCSVYTDFQQGQQIVQALLKKGDIQQTFLDEVVSFCRKNVQYF